MKSFLFRAGFSAFAVCVLLLGVMPQCRAQNAKNGAAADVAVVRREIEAVAHRADAAMARKDIKACLQYVAADFQAQGVDGSITNKKQAGDGMAQAFANAKTVRSSEKITSLRLDKGKAITTSQERTELGIADKSGKLHKVVFAGTYTDTWIKKNGTWLLWRQKELTQTVTQDGVVVSKKP